MSGHSKWATIRRKKAAIDAKRGKMFTRLIKEITIAARHGGGNPDGNPRLRLAIDNAKAANMPQDNIERAIKKATGELEGTVIEEMTYEGYGPGGIAILVEAATDNKNRTVSEIRHLFSKYNGRMGEAGSVNWMFDKKGVITLDKKLIAEDDLIMLVLDAGADDVITEGDYYEIQTSVENFEPVRRALIDKKLNPESASIQMVPKNLVKVDGKDNEAVIKLLEVLEEHDDVQNVYTNADIQEN
ncbi:MAG: YebC/PmpR family DNA-binding transcriptional regulator [Ignavibacteria bacterium]|nr:YebC/PmpR family DNA-binding transcriptional regulator [Ignavibacteria bacterium]